MRLTRSRVASASDDVRERDPPVDEHLLGLAVART
jgi:hypothetical protein